MIDIEELSKSQLILLMLLVNFITSIAVGVLTVSLLAQAPTTVTQTVNQIVDHTIETVATGTPLSTIVAPQPTITKTVVQYDDSQLPSAIAIVSAHKADIYGSGGTSTPLIAHATYLASARAVVTDTLSTGLPQEVTVVLPDGSVQPASVSHTDTLLTIYGFADSAQLPKASTLKLVSHTSLKLGQTVTGISEGGNASTGIISKIDDLISTTLPKFAPGTPAVNLAGEVVGISTSDTGLFIPAEDVMKLLNATSATSGS